MGICTNQCIKRQDWRRMPAMQIIQLFSFLLNIIATVEKI